MPAERRIPSGPEPASAEAAGALVGITLNGAPAAVAAGTTVADLVAKTLPGARAYAVELNRTVLARRDHAHRTVEPGDQIEIVTLVGGG